MKLLSIGNTKTMKGEVKGFLTGVLHLAPANLSGVNLCPFSTAECLAVCLNMSGRGRLPRQQEARIIKSIHWHNNKEGFIDQLIDDIKALERKAKRMGLLPAVRLNGTSDIMWEFWAKRVFDTFPHITFYDYTKIPLFHRRTRPENYHLTFSHTGLNRSECEYALNYCGTNVAVVFDVKSPELFPKTFMGFPVIDGVSSDLRFLDAQSSIVGLIPIGKAKNAKSNSNFVVRC